MSFGHLNDSRYRQPSRDTLSTFEKGKIAQVHGDTTWIEGLIVYLKQQLTDTNERYEELRQIIDHGSKSMTHENAVRELQTTRGVLDVMSERTKAAIAEAEGYAESFVSRLAAVTKRAGELAAWKKVYIDRANDIDAANARADKIEKAIFEPYKDGRPFDVTSALDMLELEREQHVCMLTNASERVKVAEADTEARNTAWYERSLELHKRIDAGIERIASETERASRWELAATNERTQGNKEIKRLRATLSGAAAALKDLASAMSPDSHTTAFILSLVCRMKSQTMPIKALTPTEALKMGEFDAEDWENEGGSLT